MPKRMLDSSYLNSPSLDRCSPRAQDNFPRFILLADDFGCFEADTRRLLPLGWTSKRTDVTEAEIWGWLEEYVAAGMAVLWTEKERRWCFLTGWYGEHGQRRRAEYKPDGTQDERKGSKRKTPRPPPTSWPSFWLASVGYTMESRRGPTENAISPLISRAGNRFSRAGAIIVVSLMKSFPPGKIRNPGGNAANPPGKFSFPRRRRGFPAESPRPQFQSQSQS
jgi:hypothetical protein